MTDNQLHYRADYSANIKLNEEKLKTGDKYNWKIDDSKKNSFFMKLYAIITFQLLFATFLCFVGIFSENFYTFQKNNLIMLFLIILVMFAIPFLGNFSLDTVKSFPLNYFLLTVFTLALSYVISFVCGSTNPKFVLMLIFMSFSLVFAMMIYVWFNGNLLSTLSGMIFSFAVAVALNIVFIFISDYTLLHITISSLWVILFGIYIVYDSQLILGNKDMKFSENDYVAGSFCIYTDYILIFTSICEIFCLLKED
jgi:FtsH-binding integral membrane protein